MANFAATNDNFASGQTLSGSAGSMNANNVGATKEPSEPNHAGVPDNTSLWYFWTAPANGTATFDTLQSGFDTLLAVYTSGSLATLVPVASNDDSGGTLQSSVTFTAVSGTTYRIAIDGYSGAAGAITLHWNLGSSVVATPVITPNGGVYNFSQSVSLSCATAGASIYYTTNGTTPTSTSTAYTGPFTLTTSSTVKAIALKTGFTDSAVATATFTRRR